MQIFKINGVKIEGVTACVPEIKINNETSLKDLYGDEAKSIVESTGIKTRYIAKSGTTTSDLCISCAENLLQNTNTNPENIGAVIFVTFTPDRLMPFNAAIVQQKLNLPKEIPAFDINLACSGYAYGLYTAAVFAKSLVNKKVLLLDGDIQSAYMSNQDKATLPVMADAGSATLLSSNNNSDSNSESEWYFTFLTDGSGRDFLTIPAGGSEMPFNQNHLELKNNRRDIDIYMDGFAVFKFVASDVSKWLVNFLNEINFSSENIDFFVPHQANMFMIKKLAKKLNISWDNTWKSGDEVGNSASATVPVTIAKNAGLYLKNHVSKILLSGFGGGFSASAGVVNLNSDAYYNFFQYENL